MTASEYTSLAGASVLPCACSGLMNSGVPKTIPSCVRMTDPGRIWRSPTFASPKSRSFGKSRCGPLCTRKMFSGFRSRWMMPALCASSSAPHAWMRIGSARATGNGPSERTVWFRFLPSSSSMMM